MHFATWGRVDWLQLDLFKLCPNYWLVVYNTYISTVEIGRVISPVSVSLLEGPDEPSGAHLHISGCNVTRERLVVRAVYCKLAQSGAPDRAGAVEQSLAGRQKAGRQQKLWQTKNPRWGAGFWLDAFLPSVYTNYNTNNWFYNEMQDIQGPEKLPVSFYPSGPLALCYHVS